MRLEPLPFQATALAALRRDPSERWGAAIAAMLILAAPAPSSVTPVTRMPTQRPRAVPQPQRERPPCQTAAPHADLRRRRGEEDVGGVHRIPAVRLREERKEGVAAVGQALVLTEEVPAGRRRHGCGV